MSRVLFLCPTHRDYREIGRLNGARHDTFFFHDYATLALEELVAEEPPAGIRIPDPEAEIERIVRHCREVAVDCIVSTDDYPGSTLASIVARALGLPGVDPAVNLLCQHKYHARRAQRAVVPEATPAFELVAEKGAVALPAALAFPLFIKPVKSFFSIGAQRVDSPADFLAAVRRATLPRPFFDPFATFLRKHSGLEMEGFVLAEALLEGQQSTLEGYAYQGKIHVMGIVDSVMFPGTLCFQRFEYPSRLPASVQERMGTVAQAIMSHIGYDHGFFNLELIYDPRIDSVATIEINPRMASQFADLFEKVDGINTYNVLLDLAADKAPSTTRRAGEYAKAASCVLRTFENKRALHLPSPKDIEAVQRLYPDVRIEVLAKEGRRLSQELQDGRSYRYGIISLGGRDDEDIRERVENCLARLPFVFERA
jgi:biotin carboxylase